MSSDRYTELIHEVCAIADIPDVKFVLQTRTLEVEGFEVRIEVFTNDPEAVYVNFHFGCVTAGRTLQVFKLMLEANLLIYAQEQAQLGLDGDTGGIVLLSRLPLTPDVTGEVVANLLTHYAEHGRYWRTSIIEASDEMFNGLANGDYRWLRG